jgi:uncharacterized SAM-binding protein YcdF (DUF218 family)
LDQFALKALVSTLLLPPAGPLLLVVLGLFLAWRHGRGGLALATIGLVTMWLLATPIVAHLMIGLLERDLVALTPERWQVARAGARAPRAIVVLGGGVGRDPREHPHDERLHPRALERTVQGARVARMTGLPVLLSGGTLPGYQASESELMRRVLEGDLRVRARWLEQRSRDTAGNASESAAMLKAAGIDSVVLVTHAYHMRRAQAAFEAAGVAVLPAPHHFVGVTDGRDWSDWLPGAQGTADGWLAVRELFGGWWYRLRGLA